MKSFFHNQSISFRSFLVDDPSPYLEEHGSVLRKWMVEDTVEGEQGSGVESDITKKNDARSCAQMRIALDQCVTVIPVPFKPYKLIFHHLLKNQIILIFLPSCSANALQAIIEAAKYPTQKASCIITD